MDLGAFEEDGLERSVLVVDLFFLDLIQHFKAIDELAEDRILAVETFLGLVENEELGVGGLRLV